MRRSLKPLGLAWLVGEVFHGISPEMPCLRWLVCGLTLNGHYKEMASGSLA